MAAIVDRIKACWHRIAKLVGDQFTLLLAQQPSASFQIEPIAIVGGDLGVAIVRLPQQYQPIVRRVLPSHRSHQQFVGDVGMGKDRAPAAR